MTMQEIFTPFAFILLRALSGIIPPIPGFMIDTLGIALFGSIFGLLWAEIGVMLGAVVKQKVLGIGFDAPARHGCV